MIITQNVKTAHGYLEPLRAKKIGIEKQGIAKDEYCENKA